MKPKSRSKEISVIISAYSTQQLVDVKRCIGSLKNQTLLPQEIILVLDSDETLINFYRVKMPKDVKIVDSNGIGLSNARNVGIKNATGEFVAFIDDDAYADNEWLEHLIKNYEDAEVIGVGGFAKPLWESGRPKWFPEEIDWVVGCSYKSLLKRKQTVRNPIGCNMSFRRTLFEKVGYFNANVGRVGKKLISGEEAAFSINALAKVSGSKIIYEPNAVVSHKVPRKRATITYLMSRSYYEGFSKGLIAQFELKNGYFLSSENEYLRFLFTVTLPSKLKRLYSFQSIHQLLALLASTSFVLIGFVIGRFSKNAS